MAMAPSATVNSPYPARGSADLRSNRVRSSSFESRTVLRPLRSVAEERALAHTASIPSTAHPKEDTSVHQGLPPLPHIRLTLLNVLSCLWSLYFHRSDSSD